MQMTGKKWADSPWRKYGAIYFIGFLILAQCVLVFLHDASMTSYAFGFGMGLGLLMLHLARFVEDDRAKLAISVVGSAAFCLWPVGILMHHYYYN